MKRAVAAILTLTFSLTLSLAGPPLVCHPVEIEGAASLPGHDSDWRVYKTEYDTSRLAEEALALLGPDTPALVRMETIRRAVVHGKNNPKAVRELLGALDERVKQAEEAGREDAVASFDLGYLIETVKQFRWQLDLRSMLLMRDGYSLVERAAELSGDPQMEFGAAKISQHPLKPRHEVHLRRAAAGAAEGSLLAQNLVAHFGKQGESLADLRASAAASAN
ncbi:MAG: hypothetical protein OEQ13_07650 [Acidobacteriota bacterium]|nr:hypothetical protein [Acidobacteriota bacterium]